MKKRLLSAALALALAVACLTGCGAASEEKTVAKALGLEKLPAVTHISSYDSHGGFHGDGVSCIALTFEDDQLGDILSRGSFNFTVGVYDADARVLYCCELDT